MRASLANESEPDPACRQGQVCGFGYATSAGCAPVNIGVTTPGMSFSIFTIVRRRRSNASRIIATAAKSPLRAATAAHCATFETLDVACDCRLVAALITSWMVGLALP